MKLELFVSPKGDDRWSGRLADPAAQGSDGPLATIPAARDRIRQWRQQGLLRDTPVVWLRGGRYHIDTPIRFKPEDSGPAIYQAYQDESPVIDGSVTIDDWNETRINDHAVWSADVGWLLDRYGVFRSLFVNGRRAPRARLPREGWFRVERAIGLGENPGQFDGSDRFITAAGDLDHITDFKRAEIVLQHKWVAERMPIVSYDPQTQMVVSSRRSIFHLGRVGEHSGPRYFIENTLDGLTEPGQWYLDVDQRRLYYLPQTDQQPGETRLVVPVVSQFLRLEGDPFNRAFVNDLQFRGIQFEYGDWTQPTGWGRRYDPYQPADRWHPRDSFEHFVEADGVDPTLEYASVPQAAHDVPGAIHMMGAHRCAIENCTIEHVGFYGIELGDGCQCNRVVGNHLVDLGGGGINADGADIGSDPSRFVSHNRITDNCITAGGRVFAAGVGVLICHGHGNIVSHNAISDLYYSGISVGWCWTRAIHVSRENLIICNHIHNVGQGVLADLAGIYILGVQPGTVLRGNVIHGIEHVEYGGWGIYADACTSCVVVEHNLVYDTSSEGLNNNAGNAENVYRHNIVARTGKAAVSVARDSDHYPADGGPDRAMTFIHNIVVTDGKPMFAVSMHMNREPATQQELFVTDANLFWDTSGREPVAAHEAWRTDSLSFDQWRRFGSDRNSVIADPKFASPEKGQFAIPDDSPALSTGFKRFDHTRVGPRSADERDCSARLNTPTAEEGEQL